MERVEKLLSLCGLAVTSILPVAVLAASAWALGRRLTRSVRWRSDLEGHVLALALGLGGVATGLFFLASVGQFRIRWIVILLGLVNLVGWRSWRGLPAEFRRWSERRRSTATMLVAGLLGGALAPLAVLVLYPPIEFDATLFHLPFARAVVRTHGLGFFADLRYPVVPALQHMLYAFSLKTGSVHAAHGVHTLCYLLVALLLYGWGRERSSSRAGLWAALLWLGSEAALWNGISAYVDCALTLFALATLLCLTRWVDERQPAWLLLAAAFAAFAAASKYHGLFFVGIFVLVTAWTTVRDRTLRRGAAALGLMVGLMIPWYAYVTLHTGNPVFPFASRTFGMTPWSFELQYFETDEPPVELAEQVESEGLASNFLVARVLQSTPDHLFRLPFAVFLRPERFPGRPLNPLLAIAPLLILALAIRHPTARFLGGVCAVYGFLWAHSAHDLRYLLPLVPVVALMTAEGLDRMFGWLRRQRVRWPAWLLTAGTTLLLLVGLGYQTHAITWKLGRPPLRPAAWREFLRDQYGVLGAVFAYDRRGRPDSLLYGLFCENLRFFSRRPMIGDWTGPHRFVRVFRHLDDPAELHRRLRAMGVDHLLLPDTETWRKGRLSFHRMPRPRQLASHFEVVYRDEYATLYRLRP